MILLSEGSVYSLKAVESSRIHQEGEKAELQSDKFFVLTKIGDREDKGFKPSPPLKIGKKEEAHEVEIHGDGTVYFGVMNSGATTSEPWITIKCDPAFICARFLSDTSVYELRIVDRKIEIKRLVKFWPTYGQAPVGEIIRGDKIYTSIYGALVLYEGGKEVFELFSVKEFL